MKAYASQRALWGATIVLFLSTALLGLQAAQQVTRISVSGQFTAIGVPLDSPTFVRPPRSADYMQVEPDTAIVSCERIKSALLRELQWVDRWEAKVYLRLHVRQGDNDSISVQGQEYATGWVYSVDLPDLIDRRRFYDTIVQLLLVEMASRGTRKEGIPVDMPKWLEAGMPAHLEAITTLSLLAEPFKGGTENHRPDRDTEALRQALREAPPLSLDELNWPDPNSDPVLARRYRHSSHLLVRELLRFDQGPRYMAAMLGSLHTTLNWQTSFLQAYGSHFQRMVDVDKWWMLTTALFLGREQGGVLAFEDALDQLGRILLIHLDVSMNGESMSSGETTTLQHAIERWDSTRVDSLLSVRLGRLEGLQWRSPPRLAPLIANYRETLSNYRRQRDATGGTTAEKVQALPNAKVTLRKCIRQLDDLDRALGRLRAELAAMSQSRKRNSAATPPIRRKEPRAIAVDPFNPSP